MNNPQYIIDLTRATPGTQYGEKAIVFYRKNEWNAAGLLKEGLQNHENHFGLYLGNACGKNVLTIDTVEHAEALISALQVAIGEGWLFTEEQLSKYKTKCTDTRQSIKQKINS